MVEALDGPGQLSGSPVPAAAAAVASGPGPWPRQLTRVDLHGRVAGVTDQHLLEGGERGSRRVVLPCLLESHFCSIPPMAATPIKAGFQERTL